MNKTDKNSPPKVYYTKMPSVLVWLLVNNPKSLLIYQYVLVRKGYKKGWKIHIADIAENLNMNEKTVRFFLKPLIELGLITLKGEVGKRYYEFNGSKHESLLKINPFESKVTPLPQIRTSPLPRLGSSPVPMLGSSPLPNDGSSPLPRLGSVDIREEKIKEKEMKEIDTVSVSTNPAEPKGRGVNNSPQSNSVTAEVSDPQNQMGKTNHPNHSVRPVVRLTEIEHRNTVARSLAAKLDALKRDTVNTVKNNDPGLRDNDKTPLDTARHQLSSLTVPDSETNLKHFEELFGT